MAARLIAMPKLEIKPYPNGGHAILVDGVDLGEHCVRATLTLTPERSILVLHNVVVDETRTAELTIENCVVYRVCADCGGKLPDDAPVAVD